jgi:crossover junction endodeoxyribonuclease RuvC
MQTRFRNALLNGTLLSRSRQMRSAATDAERKLWEKLRREGFGVKFKRQYAIRGYIVDFCCPQRKLIIELDGGQHMESSAYDERRTRILAQDGFRVLRFWNSDVVENLDGVLESIMQALRQEQAPSPSPLP